VGKSTLTGKLIELLRGRGLTVAVLACDPRSPLSGGALLGDRFRMPSQPDDGVFIRSLATAGGQGAVAGHLDALIHILAGFGFDVILIETVGAGQGDTRVRDLADAVVLLLQPETGDDLQWEKAGLLEVADVIAIHKADLPGSERVEAQVRSILGLSDRPPVPIIRVSSKSGDGVEALWNAIAGLPQRRQHETDSCRDDFLEAAQQFLAQRFAAGDPAIAGLFSQWRQGGIDRTKAIRELLRLLANNQQGG
jgi:LAO/AO transport system ATPase